MSDAFTCCGEIPKPHDHVWTRVYRQRGRQAHIWEVMISAHPGAPDYWKDSTEWYGTGSQDEYDRAAGMPLCIKCFVIMELYGKQEDMD